jgi:hypothetical protein
MPTVDIRKDRFLVLTHNAEPIALDAGLGTGRDRNGFRASRKVGAISPPDGFAIDRVPRLPRPLPPLVVSRAAFSLLQRASVLVGPVRPFRELGKSRL